VDSHIVQSSGFEALDAESIAMLARAQPMPRPPARLADSELSFVVPVRFNIR
jgi:protein TonB